MFPGWLSDDHESGEKSEGPIPVAQAQSGRVEGYGVFPTLASSKNIARERVDDSITNRKPFNVRSDGSRFWIPFRDAQYPFMVAVEKAKILVDIYQENGIECIEFLTGDKSKAKDGILEMLSNRDDVHKFGPRAGNPGVIVAWLSSKRNNTRYPSSQSRSRTPYASPSPTLTTRASSRGEEESEKAWGTATKIAIGGAAAWAAFKGFQWLTSRPANPSDDSRSDDSRSDDSPKK